jgi:hypothetical protein
VRRLAILGQLVATMAWLWPIGLGGRMPVGGDVTQFSLGPMAFFAKSLRSLHLPLWNDLWGYGFPGVGESQMGVYYPPHWLLYGLLGLEAAYTASLVLHTLWGGLGAYFAARRFGVSELGAALGGFAWSTCGFFAIHLPHQWGYTTGCWMPWAWGLAWSVLRGEGKPRDLFLLALVLTVQLLPGHFQLAFCTQVGILVLALEQAIERVATRTGGLAAVGRTLAAVAGAFVLAAMQIVPTYRLARLAAPRRDFEYLSGFAATPLHLVTFFAPGLFERSPLWRALVWDPFHTSPEEYLGYVGLAPLFLAFGAIGTGKRSPAVRALTAACTVTLLLALGPYVPGFELWCALPGFSFFRAPARWMLATSLALCLLAGIGFDRMKSWRRPGRGLLKFAAVGLAAPAVVLLIVEFVVASAERPGWPGIERALRVAFASLPWHQADLYDEVARAALQENRDIRVQQAWARQGVRLSRAPWPAFASQRIAIYQHELAGSVGLLLAMACLAAFSRFRGIVPAGLLVLSVIDLVWLAPPRRFDYGPIKRLVDQSPVLAHLASLPRGTRTIDALRNMPMVAGAGPVDCYRTLDLPAVESLAGIVAGPYSRLPSYASQRDAFELAFQLTGASVRILDPHSEYGPSVFVRSESFPGRFVPGDVYDPALAGWLYGVDWAAQQNKQGNTFRIWTPDASPKRAWLVPLTQESSAAILGEWSGYPAQVFNAMRKARPIDVRRPDPEHRALEFHTDGPSLIVLSELADPEWQATLSGPGGERVGPVNRAFGRPNSGAWQAVQIPESGDWSLRLTYRGRDVYIGLGVSAVAFLVFAVLFVLYGRGPGREGGGPS